MTLYFEKRGWRSGESARLLPMCRRVWFPASYVSWVCCWFSTLLREVFLQDTPVFPCPQNPTFLNSISIWIIVKHFVISLRGWRDSGAGELAAEPPYSFAKPAREFRSGEGREWIQLDSSPILSRLRHSCSRLLCQNKCSRARDPASYAGSDFVMSPWLGWLREHSLRLTLNSHLHLFTLSFRVFVLNLEIVAIFYCMHILLHAVPWCNT